MKRFFFLAVIFSILSLGSISSVSAQGSGNLTEQQVHLCLSSAADVLGIPLSQAEAMYDQGEIILEDQGSTTAVKTAAAGGNPITLLEATF